MTNGYNATLEPAHEAKSNLQVSKTKSTSVARTVLFCQEKRHKTACMTLLHPHTGPDAGDSTGDFWTIFQTAIRIGAFVLGAMSIGRKKATVCF